MTRTCRPRWMAYLAMSKLRTNMVRTFLQHSIGICRGYVLRVVRSEDGDDVARAQLVESSLVCGNKSGAIRRRRRRTRRKEYIQASPSRSTSSAGNVSHDVSSPPYTSEMFFFRCSRMACIDERKGREKGGEKQQIESNKCTSTVRKACRLNPSSLCRTFVHVPQTWCRWCLRCQCF